MGQNASDELSSKRNRPVVKIEIRHVLRPWVGGLLRTCRHAERAIAIQRETSRNLTVTAGFKQIRQRAC